MRIRNKILAALAALVSIAILALGVMYVAFLHDDALHCDTVVLSGRITSETFVTHRECLARSVAPKKTVLVTASEGGDGHAALAMGILIHRHNWDVEIMDLCPSSCANFIFPAGRTKYLHDRAMLMFHGGPHQENMTDMMIELDQKAATALNTATGTTSAEPIVLGQENKEGTVAFTFGKSAARAQVFEFLSLSDLTSFVEQLNDLRTVSDRFYQELGVNPLLPTYGQIGAYEPLYKSSSQGGFMYRLDSLQRLGINSIELVDGEWHPERSPFYKDVYEVEYP